MAGAAPKGVGPLAGRPGRNKYSDLEFQLFSRTGRAIGDFQLVRPRDRILVALSGGAASLAACALLEQHRRCFREDFELVPLHLAGAGGRERVLAELLRAWGLELETAPAPADRPDGRRGGRTETIACRRRSFLLRRQAARLGCNKIADGRLLDDFLEHFLDNLLQGRLRSLPVRQGGADGVTVIRPLVYVERREAESYASQLGLPAEERERPASPTAERVRGLMRAWEREQPRLRQNLLAALRHVRESHLL